MLELVVGAALVVLLLDGGRQLGVGRLRPVVGTVVALGLLGTLLTTAVLAVAAHLVLDLPWYAATLLAAAVAPTDPAVVFRLLRGDHGRGGTVLEGESGANDPVGIALLHSLVAAGALSAHAAGEVAVTFGLQLVVGSAVGAVAARALRGRPEVVVLAGAYAAFGLAHLLHGSGFLAVFVAGILLGDPGDRSRREVPVAELVAVLALAVALPWSDLPGAVVDGLVLAVLLLLARLVACGPLVLGLARDERALVLLGGLKGVVPLLLAAQLSPRLQAIACVAVLVSVPVQGAVVVHRARSGPG